VRRLIPLLILLIGALAAGVAFWTYSELTTPYYSPGGSEIFIEIPRGAGTRDIAGLLQAGGAIRHALPFVLYVKWTGLDRRLQAGEYRFAEPANPSQVAGRLLSGDVYYRTITIPEGLTALETVDLLSRNGIGDRQELERLLRRVEWIADLDPEAGSLEGYLFPETYRFPRRIGPEEVLKAMVREFRQRFSPLWAAGPQPENRRARDIVILASLVEKEARNAGERRLVSSVMWNRLRLRMPLACDPTIIYALKQNGTYDGNLRRQDLEIDSPYNSYRRLGLPPSPIANPGEDSLQAALSPTATAYLYYVSKNDGTHVFSRDLNSHLAAVARYQRGASRPKSR